MSALEYVAAVRAQIRAERGALDIPQGQLATRAGMSVMTVRRLEGGDKSRPAATPDVEQLADLCVVFGIPMSEFFIRAEQRLTNGDDTAEGHDVSGDPLPPPQAPDKPQPRNARR